MRGTLIQVGSGDVAIEYRDPRFAELDAQIQAAKAARQQRPAGRERKRQRACPALPREVRKEITRFARQFKRQNRKLFIADPKLKDRASRFLRSLLPPKRKRGRPGIPSVTRALLILKRLQRQQPGLKPQERWQLIYSKVIPNYKELTRELQRALEVVLREQVRGRRSQRRRRKATDTT
jgi:hypothetical protein